MPLEGVYQDPVSGTGKLVPLQCDSAGRLIVVGAVGGGGGGGTSDTTEATQLAVKNAVQSIDGKTPAAGVAQPISAAALPLPAGAATAAKQDAAAASLSSLDAKAPALAGGAVPVSAAARTCTGRQTIALVAATVTTLTVPGSSVSANIQADGGTVRITQDGSAPTATVGTRIDDGVIYPVDTVLTSVKLFSATACNVQVCYFDRA